MTLDKHFFFPAPVMCSDDQRGCSDAFSSQGVIKGQLSTIKEAWLGLWLHTASFYRLKKGDLCSLSPNGTQHPESFLHASPLLAWIGFLHGGAQTSRRSRGQFGVQKRLGESQQIPAVHDAAVPIIQGGWLVFGSCWWPWWRVAAGFRLGAQSHSWRWVNHYYLFI